GEIARCTPGEAVAELQASVGQVGLAANHLAGIVTLVDDARAVVPDDFRHLAYSVVYVADLLSEGICLRDQVPTAVVLEAGYATLLVGEGNHVVALVIGEGHAIAQRIRGNDHATEPVIRKVVGMAIRVRHRLKPVEDIMGGAGDARVLGTDIGLLGLAPTSVVAQTTLERRVLDARSLAGTTIRAIDIRVEQVGPSTHWIRDARHAT